MSSIPGRGNTSKKPDNKPAGQVVSFTRGAADRIAKVVRTVERGDTSAEGLRFTRPSDSVGAKAIRVVTFTGSWNKDSAKTVTFKFQATTPNTVSATNLLCNVTPDTASTATVAIIGKDGTAWYYVNHECRTGCLVLGSVDLKELPNYSANQEQLLGKGTNDCLKWFSVTTCTASP